MLAAGFAIHPANTQVVNYIAATSTLLCGFWYLAGYYLYLRFRDDPKTPTLLAGGLAYALACLAKEEGVTLVAVIALSEFFLPRPAPGVRTRIFAVYGLFAASSVALLARRDGAASLRTRLAGAAIAGVGIAVLAGQVLPA